MSESGRIHTAHIQEGCTREEIINSCVNAVCSKSGRDGQFQYIEKNGF